MAGEDAAAEAVADRAALVRGVWEFLLTVPELKNVRRVGVLAAEQSTVLNVRRAGAEEEGAGVQEYEVVLRVRGGEAQRAAQWAGRE